TDYSPEIKPALVGNRVFELRTYTTTPGNLDHLHARFRDQTMKLFEKHDITNIAYWTVQPNQTQKGVPDANNTLIYLLAHPSVEAGKAAFDKFRVERGLACLD